MTNVIGEHLSLEDREVNWSVLRSLKEDLRISKLDIEKEKDKAKVNLRINEAKGMYDYFLKLYSKAA